MATVRRGPSRLCFFALVPLAFGLASSSALGGSVDADTELDRSVVDEKPRASIVYGLEDSRVVCPTCASDLVEAKSLGIEQAMERLIGYCGADALPSVCPITFHLEGDSYCGPYSTGRTGMFGRGPDGNGQVCLWDVEKPNRSAPFTVENAATLQDQLLVVHEAMHGWFVGRVADGRIQEPFCKWTSFVLSEAPFGPDYCSFFRSIPDQNADVLMKYLCRIGLTSDSVSLILRQVARTASELGRDLSAAEFADIVSRILGRDAVPAFRSAGILP